MEPKKVAAMPGSMSSPELDKVNQVNAGVRGMLTKNLNVIAKMEFILSVRFTRAYHNLHGKRTRCGQ